MSKLSAFFEKKKKKSLKSSTPAGLGEKSKKDEEPVLVEEDSSEWVVDDQPAKPASPQEDSLATWLKVSVVDAASVKKKEPEKTWIAYGDGDVEGPESDGERGQSACSPEDSPEAASLSAEKAEAPAAKKWVPPSLRGKRATGGGAGACINFDDDQDLATAAQLGFYSGKGVQKKKATPTQAAKETKKEKEKKSGEGEEKQAVEELPPVPEFDVWKYVQIDGGSLGLKAPQNDEAVRAKYQNRKRLPSRSA
ncbi:hypothetical protein TGARI_209420 [Toxoplasma gondii ARI]|uniref:Uncharacterized protein n=1 Tax=Toxoplasma gondii ARI TaxID=1074872 RepID=A0A139XR59_TOXGO|nr:hypothetical protein TGARI_209420 [Toxoplasma gondii ARI]